MKYKYRLRVRLLPGRGLRLYPPKKYPLLNLAIALGYNLLILILPVFSMLFLPL